MSLTTVGDSRLQAEISFGVVYCGLTDHLVGDALVVVPQMYIWQDLLSAPAPAYPPTVCIVVVFESVLLMHFPASLCCHCELLKFDSYTLSLLFYELNENILVDMFAHTVCSGCPFLRVLRLSWRNMLIILETKFSNPLDSYRNLTWLIISILRLPAHMPCLATHWTDNWLGSKYRVTELGVWVHKHIFDITLLAYQSRETKKKKLLL